MGRMYSELLKQLRLAEEAKEKVHVSRSRLRPSLVPQKWSILRDFHPVDYLQPCLSLAVVRRD